MAIKLPTQDQIRSMTSQQGAVLLGQSAGIGQIAKANGLSRQAIYRIKDEPTAAEAVLAIWSKDQGAQRVDDPRNV